jgi:hypothetical protein
MTKENPFKVDIETFGEPVLACPACGFNYIHPVGIECHSPGMPGGVLSVSSNGISLDTKSKPVDRGVVIILKFLCECAHEFEYVFSFRKGQTYVMSRIFPEKLLRHDFLNTIWRD